MTMCVTSHDKRVSLQLQPKKRNDNYLVGFIYGCGGGWGVSRQIWLREAATADAELCRLLLLTERCRVARSS